MGFDVLLLMADFETNPRVIYVICDYIDLVSYDIRSGSEGFCLKFSRDKRYVKTHGKIAVLKDFLLFEDTVCPIKVIEHSSKLNLAHLLI